jgi:hypothetical protein
LKKDGIGVAFSPPNTIKLTMDSTKYPIELRMYKCFYYIPCSCGKFYIGEIGKSMKVRLKEHRVDLKWNITHKYTLDKQSSRTSH